MTLSPQKKILLTVVLLVELVLISAGLSYRRNFNRDFALVSSRESDASAVLDIKLERTFFPTSFAEMETWGVQAASTGRVYSQTIKEVGTATILEVVTRDRDDPDNLKRLPLIVQLVSTSNPDRNLLPWVLESAAKLRSLTFGKDTSVLTREQIAQIFPRGTTWVFVPLVDLKRKELDQLVEYTYYAEQYYGGTTYPNLGALFKESPDRHALLGEASIPILLLGIPFYLEQ